MMSETQPLGYREFAQLMEQTACKQEDQHGYLFVSEEKNYVVSHSKDQNVPEGFRRLSLQEIAELISQYKEDLLADEDLAIRETVGTNLQRMSDKRAENVEQMCCLKRLIVRICECVKNLFKGFGFTTTSGLAARLSSELNPEESSESSSSSSSSVSQSPPLSARKVHFEDEQCEEGGEKEPSQPVKKESPRTPEVSPRVQKIIDQLQGKGQVGEVQKDDEVSESGDEASDVEESEEDSNVKADEEAEAARKKEEEEAEAARKAEEEANAAVKKAEEEAEAARKAEEEAEAARKKEEEEAEAARKAEEEAEAAVKKAEEEAEAARKALEEAEVARKKEEEEAEAARKAEEEAEVARKKEEEEAEAARNAEEEAKAAAKKAEEEAEAARKTLEEAEAARKAEEEAEAAAKKAEEEAEAAKKKQLEERRLNATKSVPTLGLSTAPVPRRKSSDSLAVQATGSSKSPRPALQRRDSLNQLGKGKILKSSSRNMLFFDITTKEKALEQLGSFSSTGEIDLSNEEVKNYFTKLMEHHNRDLVNALIQWVVGPIVINENDNNKPFSVDGWAIREIEKDKDGKYQGFALGKDLFLECLETLANEEREKGVSLHILLKHFMDNFDDQSLEGIEFSDKRLNTGIKAYMNVHTSYINNAEFQMFVDWVSQREKFNDLQEDVRDLVNQKKSPEEA